jgi:contractile injection system tube protein/LysM domain-containing protein
MGLAKATIEVLDKDAINPPRLPQYLPVEFNPTEYTLNKTAQIAEIGIYGIDSPILQFIRGQNEKLTMDLFFDTTTQAGLGENAKPVTDLTDPFYQLVKIQPKTHAPPRIRFTWGDGLRFKAIVESVQRKFTLFNPKGVPLRATLSISFREYKTIEDQVAELNLQSSDHTKERVVQRGDTLSRIAADEYHDPSAWRIIADANPAIDSPRNLRPGMVLRIPPLDLLKSSQVNNGD